MDDKPLPNQIMTDHQQGFGFGLGLGLRLQRTKDTQ